MTHRWFPFSPFRGRASACADATGVWIVFAALAACAATRHEPLTGRPAPELSVSRVDGGTLALSALRGQVVVLQLWAAWSTHSTHELPELDELAARLNDVDARVVSVSLDEDPTPALKIFASRRWRLIAAYDSSGRVGDAYAPEKFPAIFVIDGNGTIRDHRHDMSAGDLAAIEQRVRALASSEGPP